MMRILASITLMAIATSGCDLTNPHTNGSSSLSPVFSIADTSGKITTNFHSGDSFLLTFSVTNTTSDTVIYQYGPPMISFRILKDSVLVSFSHEGCAEPEIFTEPDYFTTVKLAPGKSINGSWKAPTSICSTQKTILPVGSYQAEAFFPYFKNVKVDSVPPIRFEIYP